MYSSVLILSLLLFPQNPCCPFLSLVYIISMLNSDIIFSPRKGLLVILEFGFFFLAICYSLVFSKTSLVRTSLSMIFCVIEQNNRWKWFYRHCLSEVALCGIRMTYTRDQFYSLLMELLLSNRKPWELKFLSLSLSICTFTFHNLRNIILFLSCFCWDL